MLKWTICLVLLAGLAITGCGKKSAEEQMEEAIEQESGGRADVDWSKNRMTIQTREGDKIEIAGGGGGLKVPEDFPKDFFVYPGAKVEGTVKTGEASQLTLSTADAPGKVTEAYQEKMKGAGWEEKTTAQMGDMTMLHYAKDGRDAMVHITSDGERTQIMLMLSQRETQ